MEKVFERARGVSIMKSAKVLGIRIKAAITVLTSGGWK